MKDTPLNIVEHAQSVDLKICEDLLQHLRSFDDVTVLEPTYTSWQLDPDIPQKIAPGCPNLDLDSEYILDGVPSQGIFSGIVVEARK